MEENERLLAEANLTWEDKLRATESELLDRAEAAEREARVRQRENEALRREMDELREAKAREEQFRISGLKAHEAVRVAEIASMEQKLAEEKGRARKFQATLSTESDDVEEELTRQREEIARMRTEQAELIAMLQVRSLSRSHLRTQCPPQPPTSRVQRPACQYLTRIPSGLSSAPYPARLTVCGLNVDSPLLRSKKGLWRGNERPV
jgi:hypothetical protein